MKKSKIITLVSLILAISTLLCSCSLFGNDKDKKAIEAAEKYANQLAYRDVGLPPDHFKSEVIYSKDSAQLVAVEFTYDDYSSLGGSYCIFVNYGMAVRNSKYMNVKISYYKNNLKDFIAMFGV